MRQGGWKVIWVHKSSLECRDTWVQFPRCPSISWNFILAKKGRRHQELVSFGLLAETTLKDGFWLFFLCVCRLSFRIRDMLGYTVTARNSSCGKVMFSQACVKNSVHRGCLLREGGISIWGCLPRGVSAWGVCRGCLSRGGCLPKGMLGYTPPHSTMGYGQQADSTHPTGMYSCLQYICKDDTVTTCLYPLFRWFKFALKPPYSIAHDKLRLAIRDTSFWTFWLKFGHKGPWDIS